MIWLTWRQFRGAAAMTAAVLAVLAALLGLTGPGLADDFSTGNAACLAQGGGCDGFLQRFYHDNQLPHLAVTAAVLVLPALIGLFWGAPLITRELEAGTHRLVWNQSITRTRWLAVKLALTGLAVAAVAALGSLPVTWWSSPIDKSAATSGLPRLGPLLFDARGIAPIGYAAFAFALGVALGIVLHRTLPAMAITLVAFIAVQITMPLVVRPHLLPPARTTAEISTTDIDGLDIPRRGGPLHVVLKPLVPADTGAWVLSSRLADPSGNTIDGAIPVSTTTGPCGPSPNGREPGAWLTGCLAEINRLGYRHKLTHHPSSRFWTLQWYETGIYATLALALAGFSFWWLRRLS